MKYSDLASEKWYIWRDFYDSYLEKYRSKDNLQLSSLQEFLYESTWIFNANVSTILYKEVLSEYCDVYENATILYKTGTFGILWHKPWLLPVKLKYRYFKGRNFRGQKLLWVSKIAKFREIFGKNFREFSKIFIFGCQ